MNPSGHSYEIRPRKDKRGVDLISEHLPHGRLWYGGTNAVENAIGYLRFYSQTQQTEVKVFDANGALVAEHRWDPRTRTDLLS
jgi:hypothetical protein